MSQYFSFKYQALSVRYEQMGHGKPLIVLHGWGSRRRVMMPIAKQLSDIRTCYVLDLPGFGDTDAPPAAWSIDDYTDMVEVFIREQFDAPVDLLVHSFGGRIALKLCARPEAKERVDKVLITGGAGMKPQRSLSYYFKKYLAKTLKAPFLILPSPAKENALAKLRETKIWQALGSGDYAKLSGVMRETFVKSVTEYLEPCLPKIPHDVLLIWGTDDQSTPLYQGKRMEKGMPHAALVEVEKAGHYVFLDRPKHFARIARAFLEG